MPLSNPSVTVFVDVPSSLPACGWLFGSALYQLALIKSLSGLEE